MSKKNKSGAKCDIFVEFNKEQMDSKEKRRNSAPAEFLRVDETKQVSKDTGPAPKPRKDRKMMTAPAPKNRGMRGKGDMILSEESIEELQRLHTVMLAEMEGGMPPVCEQNTTKQLIDRTWTGENGTWLVFGAYPADAKMCGETPFNVRGYEVRPTSSTMSAPQLLAKRSVSICNTKGMKSSRDHAIGQDNCSISRLSGGWEAVCVMDGHGSQGHWPSTRAVQMCPFFLETGKCAEMLQKGDVVPALTRAFELTEQDLVYESIGDGIELMDSGCTAVCCVRNVAMKSVWVAWTGDSRTALLVPGRGAVRETDDHKPSIPAERARVEKMGCEVETTVLPDGDIIERIYVCGTDYPGIMMSRSLGDLSVKPYGVTAEPQVMHWSLDDYPPGCLLLSASDGVWEFIETDEVASTVLDAIAQGKTQQEAIDILLKLSQDRWDMKEEGCYCDDITAVLFPLDGVCAELRIAVPDVTSVVPDDSVAQDVSDAKEVSATRSGCSQVQDCKCTIS